MSGGTMHALFLAVTDNTSLANELNGIVMRTISQKIIDAISIRIRGFITSPDYIAQQICIRYIKSQRDSKRQNPENESKTDLELDREEFSLSFPTYKKTTIKDDDREEFLEKFEDLIKSGSKDDVWWKNYEKYRNIAEKIIDEEKPTKEKLKAEIKKIEDCFPSQGASSDRPQLSYTSHTAHNSTTESKCTRVSKHNLNKYKELLRELESQ
jgi:hypothetical protein